MSLDGLKDFHGPLHLHDLLLYECESVLQFATLLHELLELHLLIGKHRTRVHASLARLFRLAHHLIRVKHKKGITLNVCVVKYGAYDLYPQGLVAEGHAEEGDKDVGVQVVRVLLLPGLRQVH